MRMAVFVSFMLFLILGGGLTYILNVYPDFGEDPYFSTHVCSDGWLKHHLVVKSYLAH